MYQFKVNQNGYTLLSLLFALSTLIIITPLLVSFLNLIIPLHSTYNMTEFETRQFHFFLESELNQAENIQLEQNALHLFKHDETKITFEKYNNIIRRRVNNTGHEVILRNVLTFDINLISDNVFSIKCRRGDYHEYEKFYFYNWSET